MYLIKSEKVTHVFALAAAAAILFGMYCSNIIEDKFSNTLDSIQYMFTPQTNFYGNYKSPYFY